MGDPINFDDLIEAHRDARARARARLASALTGCGSGGSNNLPVSVSEGILREEVQSGAFVMLRLSVGLIFDYLRLV